MKINFWNILQSEAHLGKLEAAYQRHVFEFDAAHTVFGSIIFNVLSAYFILSDYRFFGFSSLFYLALGVRGILAGYSIWACIHISRRRIYSKLSQAVSIQILIGGLALTVINFSRPHDYLGYIPINIMLLLSSFFVAPMPRKARLGMLTAFTLLEFLNLSAKVIPVEDRPLVYLSYIFTFIFGAIISGYLLSYRRYLFMQLYERMTNEQVLRRLVMIDPLTNIKNRRMFLEQGEIELERSVRHGHTLSMALIDMDGFKEINDNFGHLAGDEVLKSFAGLVDEHTRAHDLFARLGGDEFGLLMPETGSEEAGLVVERIQNICRATNFTADGRMVQIHISVGVTNNESGSNLDHLMRQADLALYQAKRSGGNCIVWGGNVPG